MSYTNILKLDKQSTNRLMQVYFNQVTECPNQPQTRIQMHISTSRKINNKDDKESDIVLAVICLKRKINNGYEITKGPSTLIALIYQISQ